MNTKLVQLSRPITSILSKQLNYTNPLNTSVKRLYFTRHVPEPVMTIHLPKMQEGQETDSLVLEENVADESKPVILIVGWAGAQQKHIDKYVSFYNDEGYRVVSLCPPCYHYRIPNSRVGFYMSPLFTGANAKPGDFRTFANSPIVVHSFSMNGVRGLISLKKWTEAEEKPNLFNRIKGIIFDSAPARPSGKNDAKAMVWSTPAIDALEKVFSEETRIQLLTWFLNLRATLVIPLSAAIPSLRSYLSQYYYLLDKIDLPKHQLYLYSESDKMIKARQVEKFIGRQKNDEEKLVSSLMFEHSQHVQHFKSNPERYKKECFEFLKRIEAEYSK